MKIKLDCSYTVADIADRDDLTFVSVDFEVEEIKKYFGNAPEVRSCDAFFVRAEGGEYKEVYCMEGVVPTLDKQLCKIEIER